jgi:HSP20 family protein
MDFDKLRQWFDMAQKFQGKEFWSNIFDKEYANQFINEFDDHAQTSSAPNFYPKTDIISGSQEYIILIDIPGVRKEDVQLSLSGEFLYVKGTTTPFYPDMQLLTSERFTGMFERTIRLPESIGKAKISAKFDSGMLEVRIARQQKSQVQIPID